MDNTEKILHTSSRKAYSWTDYCHLRCRGYDKPKSKLGKIKFEKFLKKHNIERLKILKIFSSAKDISFTQLPDYFVLKPANLWSSRGVMLLHKIAGLDIYFDTKSNNLYSERDIVTIQTKLEDSTGKKQEFIIEERALDEDSKVLIPYDYKIFTFYGDIKFILQIDRNHKIPKLAFFDGNFTPITDNRVYLPESETNNAGSHRIPKYKNELLALAKKISLKLEAPFISIDCYSTNKGAYLGELTHTPGGPYYGRMYKFSKEFDEELGIAWTKANSQLNIKQPIIKIPYVIKSGEKVLRYVEN